MFAALYLPSLPGRPVRVDGRTLLTLAREFSPRVECVRDNLLALDLTGLARWFGGPRELGETLRRSAADRGLAPHVAVAATRTAALVGARGRAGLTVVPPGEEAARLAPLPLSVLAVVLPMVPMAPMAPMPIMMTSRAASSGKRSAKDPDSALPLATLRRWGLKTLGDLADLPAVELSERLGQAGVVWQRLARGEDVQPLVPVLSDERFEESLALEWPIETLEPLSFVLGRLFESLSARLEQADRGVAILHVRLDLVAGPDGRETFARALQLPAPMRDARTLRTLALLDLESHPPPAAIDRVTVAAEVVEGRVLQFSLLERALPAERASTLLARLSALVGADRVGSPALVDSHRPGDFAMAAFQADSRRSASREVGASAASDTRLRPVRGDGEPRGFAAPPSTENSLPGQPVMRRFRHPVPARVDVQQGRPVRVTSQRRHLRGGKVELCAGPWRTSGDWWKAGGERLRPARGARVFERRSASAEEDEWTRDEWDVSLGDGARYVVFRDRRRGHWFIDGILD